MEGLVLEDDAAVLVALIDHLSQVADHGSNFGVRGDHAFIKCRQETAVSRVFAAQAGGVFELVWMLSQLVSDALLGALEGAA